MPTMTRGDALRQTQTAERLTIEAIVQSREELIPDLVFKLKDLREVAQPVRVHIAEMINEHVEAHGEPHPEDDKDWIPPDSFAAQILNTKITEYLNSGTVEIRATLDLDEARRALEYPENAAQMVVS